MAKNNYSGYQPGCKHLVTHGMTRTPTYRTWAGLRNRCNNKNEPKYPIYGGRGIRVCPRWDAFENFYSDMGEKPSPNHSIDRIDNDGNYAPDNCRWATIFQQGNNRRNNVLITFNGKTLTRAQWCRRTGIPYFTLRYRIDAGWDIERALTETAVLGRKK